MYRCSMNVLKLPLAEGLRGNLTEKSRLVSGGLFDSLLDELEVDGIMQESDDG